MLHRLTRPFLSMVSAIALLVSVTGAALADERDFTLVNGSGVTITHVYVSHSDNADWGEDILGRDILDPGESVNVLFSGYDGEAGLCMYDIQVTGRNGEEGYLYKVDLCSTFTVTFQ